MISSSSSSSNMISNIIITIIWYHSVVQYIQVRVEYCSLAHFEAIDQAGAFSCCECFWSGSSVERRRSCPMQIPFCMQLISLPRLVLLRTSTGWVSGVPSCFEQEQFDQGQPSTMTDLDAYDLVRRAWIINIRLTICCALTLVLKHYQISLCMVTLCEIPFIGGQFVYNMTLHRRDLIMVVHMKYHS